MGFHQIKKILHSKGSNYQSEETAYKIEENLTQLSLLQGINIHDI
jgi:hypothetical protein